jgi:hypothetical protein
MARLTLARKIAAITLIGHESPIGPCVATHAVDNRQACCFRNARRCYQSEIKLTGEKTYLRFGRGDETSLLGLEEDSGTACDVTVAQSYSVDRKIMSQSSCQYS